MSTYTRVRALAGDMDALRREVAGLAGQLDSVRDLVADAVGQRDGWQEAFEARAAERERSGDGALRDQLRQVTAAMDGLRQDLGLVRESVQRVERERAVWRVASERRAADRERTVDGILQDLLRQLAGARDGLRDELGLVREAVQRVDEERAVWREAVEAPATRLEQSVNDALQDLLRRVAGASDGLREEMGRVREAVQRVGGEWAEHEQAAEARSLESGHLLVHAREQLSNVLGELSDILRDRAGIAPTGMAGGSASGDAAQEGRQAVPVPVVVEEGPSEVSARSTTVYYFQLEKGEELPDLDAVTTPYVAARMAARREEDTLESS